MRTFESESGYVAVRLDPGDMALESIRTACEEHDVGTGAVVSGIGTFRNLHVHYFAGEHPRVDDGDVFLELDGAWEINGIAGMIADGEPHLHVTAFDGERTIAGHLEEGNEVNALCEILIRKVDGLDLVRRPNEFDIPMLESRDRDESEAGE